MPELSAGRILVCTGAIRVFALRTSHAPIKRVMGKPSRSRRAGEVKMVLLQKTIPIGPFFNSQPLNPNFVMYGRVVLLHSTSISEKSP